MKAVARHAEALYPNECCGLIVRGLRGQTHCRPGENLETGPGLFSLNPSTIIETHRREETITGLYHSHCDGSSKLSQTDIEALVVDDRSLWPDVDVFIASVQSGHCVCVQRFVWSDVNKTYEASEQHRP